METRFLTCCWWTHPNRFLTVNKLNTKRRNHFLLTSDHMFQNNWSASKPQLRSGSPLKVRTHPSLVSWTACWLRFQNRNWHFALYMVNLASRKFLRFWAGNLPPLLSRNKFNDLTVVFSARWWLKRSDKIGHLTVHQGNSSSEIVRQSRRTAALSSDRALRVRQLNYLPSSKPSSEWLITVRPATSQNKIDHYIG